MSPEYSTEKTVLVSKCSPDGRMRMYDAVYMCQDLAAFHNEILGVGIHGMLEKGMHWVAAKIKIRIYDMPGLMSDIRLSTQVRLLENGALEREYAVSDAEKMLFCMKTLFIAVDHASGRPVDSAAGLLSGLEKTDKSFLPQPFEKCRLNLNTPPVASYRVNTIDLDFIGHMNNCAYLRAFQSIFTTAQWNEMNITDLEITYIKPVLEGDIIEFRRENKGTKNYYQLTSGGAVVAVIITDSVNY